MTKVRMRLRWIETNGSLFPVCYSIVCSLFALGLQLEIIRKLIHISFIHSITVLAMHLDATYSCNVFNDWHVLSRSAILTPLTHIFLALNWNNISDLAEWQMFGCSYTVQNAVEKWISPSNLIIILNWVWGHKYDSFLLLFVLQIRSSCCFRSTQSFSVACVAAAN